MSGRLDTYRLKRIIDDLELRLSTDLDTVNSNLGSSVRQVTSDVEELKARPVGGEFSGTMDDIEDGTTYVKTENNYTDEEKTKLAGLGESNGLTQQQIEGLI